MVETLAEIMQGVITALADFGDDRADIGLDIHGDFSLRGQKRGKAGFEIRLPGIEPQYQCAAPNSNHHHRAACRRLKPRRAIRANRPEDGAV
jgi:hypothetical protein